MKRFLSLLLALFLLLPAASAEPLSLVEDYADTVTVFYNGTDESAGLYRYSYRYPRVSGADPEDLSAVCVNEFYRKKIQEYLDDYIPSLADYYRSIFQSVSVNVSYEVTCSTDDYFSVLIHKTEEVEGEIIETWEGNTFSRSSEMIGSVTSLPKLLGVLEDGASDEWLETRQSQKVCEALCVLVWDAVQENPDGRAYYPDLTEEDLAYIIDPVYSLDHDFYMDEAGNLVFFILPGRAAPAEDGLMTFTFTLEELEDEL